MLENKIRYTLEQSREIDEHLNIQSENEAFFRFVEANPMLDINELAKEFHRPVEWCQDRLGYFKLEPLNAHCALMRIIKPLNAAMLAKLTHEEQLRFAQQAVMMPPTDFRIVVMEFIRAKVVQIPLPLLTMVEIAREAIEVVPLQKMYIKKLSAELQHVYRRYAEIQVELRRAIGADPDRVYKD